MGSSFACHVLIFPVMGSSFACHVLIFLVMGSSFTCHVLIFLVMGCSFTCHVLIFLVMGSSIVILISSYRYLLPYSDSHIYNDSAENIIKSKQLPRSSVMLPDMKLRAKYWFFIFISVISGLLFYVFFLFFLSCIHLHSLVKFKRTFVEICFFLARIMYNCILYIYSRIRRGFLYFNYYIKTCQTNIICLFIPRLIFLGSIT